MGRPIAKIPDDRIELALVYLTNAATRNSTVFKAKHGAARGQLAQLRLTCASSPPAQGAVLVNAWVDEHLTKEGRARMLAALRRRRADAAAPRRRPSGTIRLPAKTVRALNGVARRAGLSLAQLLAAFAAGVQADDAVLAQLRQHAAGPDFE